MATARAEHAKPRDDAQHSGRLLLRLPPRMHSELAQAAERECTSLNAYITQALLGVAERPRAAARRGRSQPVHARSP